MGSITVSIQVYDREALRFEQIDVLVDTGSTYTAVPRAMLERLGVTVQRSMPSQTADGRIVPVDIGQTIVRLEGIEFYTPVIFAEANKPSVLGVVTLGEAGLAVDPVNGRLIPTIHRRGFSTQLTAFRSIGVRRTPVPPYVASDVSKNSMIFRTCSMTSSRTSPYSAPSFRWMGTS